MLRITVLSIFSLVVPSFALHCLVLSPRHGLVAHKCTNRNAVGCRIRVERDSISWYDLSRRHDKHMACLLRGEFGSDRRSGCVKKPSGTVRCWCYGQSNCNSPEKSRRLFEAFASGDSERFNREVVELDTEDPVDYETETMEHVEYQLKEEQKAPKTTTEVKFAEREDAKRSPNKAKLEQKLVTRTPIAIEIKTRDDDDLNSVEYLPAITPDSPVLPTTPSLKEEARALPTDTSDNVFDTYSLMEDTASEYDIESETREPDGHYKVNVVKIRSKNAEQSAEEDYGNSATTPCHFIAALLVACFLILL